MFDGHYPILIDLPNWKL